MSQLDDPEQEINLNVMQKIATALGMREEIQPRLLYRAISWAISELIQREYTIEAIKRAIRGE